MGGFRIADNGDITLKNGESTRLIQPGREMSDMHLDYGYAGTAHRAQGASEAFVIALAGATDARQRLASLSDAYVALSRMKQHVQVYTDDTGKWLASVAASESRKTAHDVLDVQQDVHATTAQNLWDSARALNQNALGRALLRETGLPDHSEARFISGSRKYPAPHVAWPAYDRNGRQQGIWLQEIRMNEEGRMQGLDEQGRWLGRDDAAIVVLQQSHNGVTLTASDPASALALARQHPESGVVLQQEAAQLPGWLLQKLTQGQAEMTPEAMKTEQAAQNTDAELLSLQTPEERARQEAEKAVRETLQQDEVRNILPAENEVMQDAENAVAEQDIRAAGQAAAREEKENAQLLQREVAALKRINAQEQLRQMEKELVIDREKTL